MYRDLSIIKRLTIPYVPLVSGFLGLAGLEPARFRRVLRLIPQSATAVTIAPNPTPGLSRLSCLFLREGHRQSLLGLAGFEPAIVVSDIYFQTPKVIGTTKTLVPLSSIAVSTITVNLRLLPPQPYNSSMVSHSRRSPKRYGALVREGRI